MNRLDKKSQNLKRRKARVRSTISGTPTRPRLTVSISILHVSAQLIDDTTGKTLAHASSIGSKSASGNLSAKATFIGTEIADRAKKAKIKSVVFDRNGRLYHGRIKALADAARAGGLEF